MSSICGTRGGNPNSDHVNVTKVANDRQQVEGYLKELESIETIKSRVFEIADKMESLGYTITVHRNSNEINITFQGVAYRTMNTSNEVSVVLHARRGVMYTIQQKW